MTLEQEFELMVSQSRHHQSASSQRNTDVGLLAYTIEADFADEEFLTRKAIG